MTAAAIKNTEPGSKEWKLGPASSKCVSKPGLALSKTVSKSRPASLKGTLKSGSALLKTVARPGLVLSKTMSKPSPAS